MRRRAEAVALVAVALIAAAWAFHGALGVARWNVVGALELARASASPPVAPIAVPTHIAHAGGAYRQQAYTNSLEALDHNYARGARWFEVDFLRDEHGTWWAAHDWSRVHELLGITVEAARRFPEQQPAGGRFRVARLQRILDWLAAHPDARLVTDTKDDNLALLRALQAAPPPLRRRIHPQLYRLPEYAEAVRGEFAEPIFTTYRSRYPWWVLDRFARAHPLLAVTVTRAEVPEAVRRLSGRVPLLTHTVNDSAEEARLGAAGIAGIYTDDLLP